MDIQALERKRDAVLAERASIEQQREHALAQAQQCERALEQFNGRVAAIQELIDEETGSAAVQSVELDLEKQTRAELHELAANVGVLGAEQMRNKAEVIKAIRQAQAEAIKRREKPSGPNRRVRRQAQRTAKRASKRKGAAK